MYNIPPKFSKLALPLWAWSYFVEWLTHQED